MILFTLLLALQSADRLPPAHALPPPDDDTAAVLATVDRLLAGQTARDRAAILAQVRADGGATVAVEQRDGTRTTRSLTWTEFADTSPSLPNRTEHRLSRPAVEIDGNLALVWAPYRLIEGRDVARCGIDHVSLVREADGWKVAHITQSQVTSGCNAD